MGKFSGKSCRLVCMISLTTTFFLVEIFVGYFTNSVALVADSFHMLSDVVALLIAFISVRIATKQWSKNTYGWARAEVLGALINAVFLMALCFSIFVEALKRFFEHDVIKRPVLILYVGVTGLVINVIGLFLFHEHGHSHGHSHKASKKDAVDKSKENHPLNEAKQPLKAENPPKTGNSSQLNMRGVFLHVMADALGSVVVIVSALVIWLTNWKYKFYVDPALSIIMVLLITRTTWPLLVDSARILLQTVPEHIKVDTLQKKLIKNIEGVIGVHEFHIWQLSGERIIASAHVNCQNSLEYMKIAEKVKEFFHKEGIHSTTIQLEILCHENEEGKDENKECMLICPSLENCQDRTCCKISHVVQKKLENGISVSIVVPEKLQEESNKIPFKLETIV